MGPHPRLDYVNALGALTGNQAVQMVKAGLQAIYLSGWQVAGDANLAEQIYPDQSLYPVNSVPALVRRINNALRGPTRSSGRRARTTPTGWSRSWPTPRPASVAPLNAFELMKSMIEAGAAGVHFEDQLAAEKKCGHMGGKVLVPTAQHVRTLIAARLAADVLGVPTVLVARTDANGADLLTSDIDPRDQAFTDRRAHQRGLLPGAERASTRPSSRGLAYAPYADLIWCETAHPDLDEAARFAEAIHAEFPDKMLAYNCSPSFNWKKHLDDGTIAKFQQELGAMGYKFQFITLAGFHALNASMFELARGYADEGMTAYVRLQEHEFDMEKDGYTATRHQREVGAGYFDQVAQVISGGAASTLAMHGSTEEEQF